MSAISGKSGDVKIASTSVAEVIGWTFNRKSMVGKYASNTTAGYRKAVAGVKDGSGTVSLKHDPSASSISTIKEGTSVTLKLYTNATEFFTVPAVVESLAFKVDLDNGEIVGVECSFESDGAWTDPS